MMTNPQPHSPAPTQVSLRSSRDQRRFAVVSAASASVLGVFLFVSRVYESTAWAIEIGIAVVVLATIGLTQWQRRNLGTIPKGGNRLTIYASVAVLIVWIGAATVINYLERNGDTLSPGWYALAAITAVSPALVASYVMYRRAS